jgi:hypothetical protein
VISTHFSNLIPQSVTKQWPNTTTTQRWCNTVGLVHCYACSCMHKQYWSLCILLHSGGTSRQPTVHRYPFFFFFWDCTRYACSCCMHGSLLHNVLCMHLFYQHWRTVCHQGSTLCTEHGACTRKYIYAHNHMHTIEYSCMSIKKQDCVVHWRHTTCYSTAACVHAALPVVTLLAVTR